MDRFLHEHRKAGAAADAGHFTVNVGRMVEKMRRFQSREPALYFLKAVQAATLLEAKRFDIRIGRATVEITFSPQQDLVLSLESLLTPQEHDSSPAQHLSLMLLSALSLEPREIRLDWCSAGTEQRWTLSGGVVSVPSSKAENRPNLCRLQIQRRAVGLLERILPMAGMFGVQATLTARCAFCPVPIFFDGRRLNPQGPERHPLFQTALPKSARTDRQPAWSVEKIWCRTQTPHLMLSSYWNRHPGQVELDGLLYPTICRQFQGPLVSQRSILKNLDAGWRVLERDSVHLSDQPRFLGFQAEEQKGHSGPERRSSLVLYWNKREKQDGIGAERWMGLHYSPTTTNLLIYIKAGVALDPIESSGGWPGYCCLWSRDDIPTDLGQLQVHTNTFVETDLQWLHEHQDQLVSEKGVRDNRLSRDPETFTPDLKAIWNREYFLEFEGENLVLGRACDRFHIRAFFEDILLLRIDPNARALVLDCGPRGNPQRQELAPFSKVTRISLNWVNYLRERDWPAEDEWTLQVRLELTVGRNYLRFQTGGYAKYNLPFDYNGLKAWCEKLSQATGAKLVAQKGKNPMW